MPRNGSQPASYIAGKFGHFDFFLQMHLSKKLLFDLYTEGFPHERRVSSGIFTLAENNFKCGNFPVYSSLSAEISF